MITNEQYKGGAGSMTEYRAQRVDTYEDALSIALYRCERFGEKQVIRIFKDTPRNRAMGRYLVRAYDSLGERRTRLYQRLRDRGLTREQAAAMTGLMTPCERAGVHLPGTGHSQTDCPTMGAEEDS